MIQTLPAIFQHFQPEQKNGSYCSNGCLQPPLQHPPKWNSKLQEAKPKNNYKELFVFFIRSKNQNSTWKPVCVDTQRRRDAGRSLERCCQKNDAETVSNSFVSFHFYSSELWLSDEVCVLNRTPNCFCLFFIGLKERSVCSVCLSFHFLMFDIFS